MATLNEFFGHNFMVPLPNLTHRILNILILCLHYHQVHIPLASNLFLLEKYI